MISSDRKSEFWHRVTFGGLLIALIAASIIRSSIATSQDSFTFDEAYHVGAGAVYVKTGDFRLNPEQPPLTKLWVGAYVTLLGYEMSPFRALADKSDERDFVEQDAYNRNEPDVLQERTRTAMFALNGLLILFFALSVWRVFSGLVALAVTGFLAVDPTIAAHLPVIMTDLPLGLTSGTAVLLAVQAFRTWRSLDLTLVSAALGLTLTTKHSAVVTVAVVALIGLVMALIFAGGIGFSVRLKRCAALLLVLAGSTAILWGTYFFHYYEARDTTEETFNRPLTTKIADVKSPIYRTGLNVISSAKLFPRPYTWGLADTIRAGAEGRAIPILAFGESYYSRGPFYYFPGVIAAKLPIGLLILTLIGAGLAVGRRLPSQFYPPLFGLTALAAVYLLVLMAGSSYAGVRHALAVYPLVSVLGGIAIFKLFETRSKFLTTGCSLLLAAAIYSSVFVMRPWEYFNEFAGGPENAYKYFSDEGVDLGLRLEDMARFYDSELKPNGDLPWASYFSSDVERKRRGIEVVGGDRERDKEKLDADVMEGTIMVGATEVTKKLWWDGWVHLREAGPVSRMGNLLVFRGSFPKPKALKARSLYWRAVYGKIYVAEPDIPAAIEMLTQSVEFDPSAFFVSLELANQHLALGNRVEALKFYEMAYEFSPRSDNISEVLREQVEKLRTDLNAEVSPIRNPGLE